MPLHSNNKPPGHFYLGRRHKTHAYDSALQNKKPITSAIEVISIKCILAYARENFIPNRVIILYCLMKSSICRRIGCKNARRYKRLKIFSMRCYPIRKKTSIVPILLSGLSGIFIERGMCSWYNMNGKEVLPRLCRNRFQS